MPITPEHLSFIAQGKKITVTNSEVQEAAAMMYEADRESAHYQAVMKYTADNPHDAVQYHMAIFYALERGLLSLDANGKLPLIGTTNRSADYQSFLDHMEGRADDELPKNKEFPATAQEIGWYKKFQLEKAIKAARYGTASPVQLRLLDRKEVPVSDNAKKRTAQKEKRFS